MVYESTKISLVWKDRALAVLSLESNMDQFPSVGGINTLRLRQNGHHFTDNIFKCISLNEKFWILSKISLKYIPYGLIDNIGALVQVITRHWAGDKPLSESILLCCASLGLNESIFNQICFQIHSGIIRDVVFLHESWPWCRGQKTLLTVGSDGLCKVSTLDGRILHVLDTGQALNCVAPTPEMYGSSSDDGFTSEWIHWDAISF